MTSVQDIDLRDPQLTSFRLDADGPDEGRRPAPGVRAEPPRSAGDDIAIVKAIAIIWHYTRRSVGQPELPRTDFGSLDVALPAGPSRPAPDAPRDQLGVHGQRAGRPHRDPRRLA